MTTETTQAEPKVQTEDQELLEIAVAQVNEAIGHLTVGFQREILATALSRIPEDLAEAEAIDDEQIEVLCGQRPGRIGHMNLDD